MSLIVPLAMILGGIILKKCSLGEPDDIVGYRTSRSMKSKEAWTFANEYCGKLWLIWGAFMLFITVGFDILYFKFNGYNTGVMLALMIVQLVLMFIPIGFVEKALKNRFDENGNIKD